MLKKIFFVLFALFFYNFFNHYEINAKEYCHIFENETLIDTVELPFYFHKLTIHAETSASLPIITNNYEATYIDSLTKCESINAIVIIPTNLMQYDAVIYDYSAFYYNNDDLMNFFDNAKLKNNTSKIKGYATVIDQEPPYFQGYKEIYTTNIDNPIELKLLMRNISAYDKRDGNLTNKIIVEYSEYEENKNKPGVYLTILSVQDTSNNKSSISFNIETLDTTGPIITGNNNYISYLSNPLSIEEVKNNLKAMDNTNENLTSQIYVCDDTYSINKNKKGTYSVYFCVYDKFNNLSSPYLTTIEVKDDIPPIIEGLNNFTSYLSSPLSIKEILYSLTAVDNHMDISESIYIIDDFYSQYLNTPGEKNIYFQAMDDSSNVSEIFKVTINLIDNIAPQIFGLDTYTSNLSSPLSLSYLKQQLTVLDNLEGNISTNLEIVEDTYSNNINKKGTYHITFQAKDSYNNASETFKINIKNIDDIVPTIIGPNSLTYTINNKPTINNILSEYEAKDNSNDNLKINVVKDNYSNSLTTGTYYIELNTIDSSNNVSPSFIIKINVVELLLNLNELSIYVPTNNILTIEEINSLINLNEEYTILENTYTPNYSIEGIYKIQYKLQDNSKIILKVKTYTPNQDQIINKEIKTKKETFFSKIKSFFSKIIKSIKSFIKKLNITYIFLKF